MPRRQKNAKRRKQITNNDHATESVARSRNDLVRSEQREQTKTNYASILKKSDAGYEQRSGNEVARSGNEVVIESSNKTRFHVLPPTRKPNISIRKSSNLSYERWVDYYIIHLSHIHNIFVERMGYISESIFFRWLWKISSGELDGYETEPA